MTYTPSYKPNPKVVVLVTSDELNDQFFKNSTHMPYLHVNSTNKVFPSLFTHQPGTLIIDYDYLASEFEELIRRIRTNTFYNKLKICCLKSAANRKADEELRTIGVDFLVYKTNKLTFS